ncbi:hypothetical protein SLEP1_g13166 [Rubroshorea leprosula]|uniref:Uncharacterized protein n=1 Tax=Rubroshorea leprosula TaxID=152421 RepID=A0AAV5IJF5_9ROSI|nr:hypothetical protein SLEP1_g13166 [Rubroshorea leprosula]
MHRRGILWKYTTGGLNFLDFWKEAPLKEALGVFDFSHFPVWEIRSVNGKCPGSHPSPPLDPSFQYMGFLLCG